jgi:uncharacterized protein (TIGR03437 family)
MRAAVFCLGLPLVCASVFGATFGTVVQMVGGASDIVLDESRGRLYLVNNPQNRVEIYAIGQRRFLNPVSTDSNPGAAAMSRSGKYLYVTSYDASTVDVIDLDTQSLVRKVSIPAKPEGIAVGHDELVLISTIGTGANNALNVLLVWDPGATDSNALSPVPIQPPTPGTPPTSPPSGRPYLVSRSQLAASRDGTIIVGANLPTTTTTAVFVYEVKSRTVLRSRTIANLSSVLAVAADNSRFMSGLTLFDASTLEVLAQQNIANAPFPVGTGTSFNVQTVQGGSAFSPDGSVLYSAFDIAPVQNPPARPNISQLLFNDPDNLLIRSALQLPENLSGKMVSSSDGGTLYAISESGFVIIPLSTMSQSAIAAVDNPVLLLTNDQCASTGANSQTIAVRNDGRARMTLTAQVFDATTIGAGAVGGGGTASTPSAAVSANAPRVRVGTSGSNSTLTFDFATTTAARNPGTLNPFHTFLLQSSEAINVPPAVTVYQNFRNTESNGLIVPVPVGLTISERLVDLVYDSTRSRVYIANSGLNRIEVFDTRTRTLLAPIKVGQLPHSLALAGDGNTLYVANTGGENIGIVDLNQGKMVDRIHFPPIPFNQAVALVTPNIIAATERGALIIMSNGTIWKMVGKEVVQRPTSALIGTAAIAAPRQMAATPGGEYVIVMAGNGFVYLYDALADEFVQSRQVFTTITGYFGPMAAGPQGQYFVVNGVVLNRALTPISNAGTITVSGARPTSVSRPVAAVAPVNGTTLVRYIAPVLQSATATPTDTGSVELADINSGSALRSTATLEGPPTLTAVTTRANVNARTIAIDAAGGAAYVITGSGLSVVTMETAPASVRPSVNSGGIVGLANYVASFAPNSLISIFGRNLGDQATGAAPLPTILGGTCITLNGNPIPLIMTSDTQINAQIPPELATGRYPLIIRSLTNKSASTSQTITVARYAPAVFGFGSTGLAALFHADGQVVDMDHKATRDQPLVMYAAGLGATTGGRATSGNLSPSSPLAVPDTVKVYFGNPKIKEAEVIVDKAFLLPGTIGVYQLNLRIPGAHINGDALPITIRMGTVDSPQKGPFIATVPVE